MAGGLSRAGTCRSAYSRQPHRAQRLKPRALGAGQGRMDPRLGQRCTGRSSRFMGPTLPASPESSAAAATCTRARQQQSNRALCLHHQEPRHRGQRHLSTEFRKSALQQPQGRNLCPRPSPPGCTVPSACDPELWAQAKEPQTLGWDSGPLHDPEAFWETPCQPPSWAQLQQPLHMGAAALVATQDHALTAARRTPGPEAAQRLIRVVRPSCRRMGTGYSTISWRLPYAQRMNTLLWVPARKS